MNPVKKPKHMTKLFITDDGSHSLMSDMFGVAYHSTHGAIRETQHVFIAAGLHYCVEKGATELTILDIGFGTGLNALMTFEEAKRLNIKINYHAFENYPLSILQVEALNYAQMLHISPTHFLNMHRCPFGEAIVISEQFIFTKTQCDFSEIDIDNRADIVYFDAFDPQTQPELWSETLFSRMYKALKPEGILTTYCAKGSVKRALKAVGFELQSLAGPPPKREMTRAIKKIV